MTAKLALAVVAALALSACASVAPPELRPHVTPRGVVIKNFHPAPTAQQDQERSAAKAPWWPRNRP